VLSRQPAAADDKAEDNLRGVIDTTAQKPTDGEPVTGGPSIEEYTPGLADKSADILWASNVSGAPTSVARRWHCGPAGRDRFGQEIRYVPEWGKGLTWDGKPWSKDRGGALVLYAVETARAIFADAERVADEEEQKKIERSGPYSCRA
jgi:hypothetical protein